MAESRRPGAMGTLPGGGAVNPPGRKPRRTKVGRVTSAKMNKTVVVAVELVTRHRLYGRIVRRTRRFKAHDENNQCQVGDTVLIAESRPLSKEKHWVVQQILRRGTGEPLELAELPEET